MSQQLQAILDHRDDTIIRCGNMNCGAVVGRICTNPFDESLRYAAVLEGWHWHADCQAWLPESLQVLKDARHGRPTKRRRKGMPTYVTTDGRESEDRPTNAIQLVHPIHVLPQDVLCPSCRQLNTFAGPALRVRVIDAKDPLVVDDWNRHNYVLSAVPHHRR